MPDTAARGDHVIAERAFLLGADAQNGLARTLVQRVRLELDADAAQRLESVPQHQVFRLGVDRGALPRAGDPRPADFDAAVRAVDVSVARRADGPARGALDRGERQGRARGLLRERRLDIRAHLLRRADGSGNPAPQVLVQAGLAQRRVMRERQRLQAHVLPFERHRFDDHSHAAESGSPARIRGLI